MSKQYLGASRVLIDVRQVAEMIGCSTRTVYRFSDAGKMPRPLKLGGAVRWRRSDIEQWIADGCRPVRPTRKGVAQ